MFKGTDTVNVPLRLQELLDVVVQEVLLDVLVPRHQLHVVDLQCFTIKKKKISNWFNRGQRIAFCTQKLDFVPLNLLLWHQQSMKFPQIRAQYVYRFGPIRELPSTKYLT